MEELLIHSKAHFHFNDCCNYVKVFSLCGWICIDWVGCVCWFDGCWACGGVVMGPWWDALSHAPTGSHRLQRLFSFICTHLLDVKVETVRRKLVLVHSRSVTPATGDGRPISDPLSQSPSNRVGLSACWLASRSVACKGSSPALASPLWFHSFKKKCRTGASSGWVRWWREPVRPTHSQRWNSARSTGWLKY